MIKIAAFYQFASLPKPGDIRLELRKFMQSHGVRGTVLLAPEGINGTISGEEKAIDETLSWLRVLPGFENLAAKFSHSETHPFARTKVKLKREIVSFGLPAAPHEKTGTQLDAKAWNDILSRPETIVLDARNIYEVEMGTFEQARNPQTRHFRHLPAYVMQELGAHKDRPIATFCTGGIRCEKLTSWMIEQGFSNVFQLRGGILQYLQDCPTQESKFQGECFVFDERVAVDENSEPVTNRK